MATSISFLSPVAFFVTFGCVLLTAIYRVYFHPLSKFPGPWYYAVSQIPITIQRIKGDEVATYARLHQKYGQYVRVAPGELSSINPAAATGVYGHRNAARQIPKDFKAYYMKNQRGDGTEGLMTADDESHRRMRKVFSPAFSDRAIREQEPLLKKYTDLFVQKSGECCDSKVQPSVVGGEYVSESYTACKLKSATHSRAENNDEATPSPTKATNYQD